MADEYIKREDVEEKIERLRDKCGNDEMEFALNWALKRIKEIPSADVQSVVRGKWVIMSGTVSRRQCTACV